MSVLTLDTLRRAMPDADEHGPARCLDALNDAMERFWPRSFGWRPQPRGRAVACVTRPWTGK